MTDKKKRKIRVVVCECCGREVIKARWPATFTACDICFAIFIHTDKPSHLIDRGDL